MKLLRRKAYLLFAGIIAVAMSCGDEEKVSPSSSQNDDGKEIIAHIDPDFVSSVSGKNDNAKVSTITVKRFQGFFCRNVQATTGSIRFKLYEGSSSTPLLQSVLVNVSAFPIKQAGNPSATVSFPINTALNLSPTYRVEVECVNCTAGQVYWWRSLGNVYPNGSAQRNTGSGWVAEANDFTFRIYNQNSDGSEYVGRYQGLRNDTYTLNAGIRYSQTFRAELGNDYIISFPDPALEQAVRQVAGLDSDEPITYGDALDITALDASGITNLEGIDYLENLQTLTLVTNSNLNLAPLRALSRLKSLYLHGKNITNITPLANLTTLTYLLLSNDQITTIAPLASLTNLNELVIFADKLTGVGVLGAIASNLKRLEIESDELIDVTSFASLANVERLKFRAPKVTNISSFTGLKKLIDLKIYASEYNPENPVDKTSELTNISALAGLSTLTSLEIKETKVSNISALSGLVNLTELRLPDNKIINIGAVASLTKLQTLVLNNNQIQTIPQSSASLTQLSDLNLSDNQLTTLANLNLITSLNYLYLYGNVNITQQMVNTLKQQLPDTEIFF